MKTLELYLIDCENKRRRKRDRPSNEVLAELRMLLAQMEDASLGAPASEQHDDDGVTLDERDSTALGGLDGVSAGA